ncbi:MraY family glycosyltransferase [Tengunoibacter tsumagoiensis]|uniref:Undecaprenyl-phosphate alpha-N-acetylglucosaminyl 1-phosphate transferase n=1 Tax=Tengunoibacter tsumagoiensis TaxID=2014871 RepID=A0A402A4I8_9CHLR|nr:MraY family glycosyltransferase [Tengunoibacter tsumagoiensis]GCE13915.1 undecaprenyl-phosphate alpha-N-acetylglucosaminyl 1-phosphate transferase [Tengunoibacter tsumagoiensis]
MVFMSEVHTPLLLFIPTFLSNNLVTLLVGGACACLLSYLFCLLIIYLYRKSGWTRPVEPGRKPDTIARLGGVGIFLSFVFMSFVFYLPHPDLRVCGPQNCELTSYWLFLVAATLIVAVHAYDDLKPMKPLPKLLAQTLSVFIVMGPYLNGRFNGVLLYGFSNPFQAAVQSPALPWYQHDVVTLIIHQPVINLLAIPAVLFTWFWMVGMMNSLNWIDGVDGLAGGVVVITSACITIISWTLQQYTISILAALFTGATLGFLLLNWNPAKIFMGDSGSQFLGLGLAVLSIIGGAKFALALMVMGIPIINMAVVIINRIHRGQSPMQYDLSHLHDRLKSTGLNARQICYIFYSFTAIFGLMALWFVHLYKFLGISIVVLMMSGLVVWLDRNQNHASKIQNGGGEPHLEGKKGKREPEFQVPTSEYNHEFTRVTPLPAAPSAAPVLDDGPFPH